jgi:copper chaperone CopZ
MQIVHELLSKVPGVKGVEIDLDKATAKIETDKTVTTEALRQALAGSLYELAEEVKSNAQENSSVTNSQKNKELVTTYITAAGKMDYKALSFCLDPDFEFDGAIHLHSADDYIKMIKEHAESGVSEIVLGNEIQAIFTDGDEACVIYDVVTNTAVERVPFFEKLVLKNDKIASVEVKFDRQQMKLLMQEVRKWQETK